MKLTLKQNAKIVTKNFSTGKPYQKPQIQLETLEQGWVRGFLEDFEDMMPELVAGAVVELIVTEREYNGKVFKNVKPPKEASGGGDEASLGQALANSLIVEKLDNLGTLIRQVEKNLTKHITFALGGGEDPSPPMTSEEEPPELTDDDLPF